MDKKRKTILAPAGEFLIIDQIPMPVFFGNLLNQNIRLKLGISSLFTSLLSLKPLKNAARIADRLNNVEINKKVKMIKGKIIFVLCSNLNAKKIVKTMIGKKNEDNIVVRTMIRPHNLKICQLNG